MSAKISHGEGCRRGCDPYGVGYGRVVEVPRGLRPRAMGWVCSAYLNNAHPSDAGGYDFHRWKYKRIRRYRVCCTPEGVQRKIEACEDGHETFVDSSSFWFRFVKYRPSGGGTGGWYSP